MSCKVYEEYMKVLQNVGNDINLTSEDRLNVKVLFNKVEELYLLKCPSVETKQVESHPYNNSI